MKKYSLCLLIAVIIFAFCSCSETPGNGGDFTDYLTETVKSLDPQTVNGTSGLTVVSAIFEGLCRLDSDGKALPGVAQEWEANSDNTQYTFTLRDDAKWSNGEAVTAYDFVFAIKRALTPDTKATNVDDLFVIRGAKDVYNGAADSSSIGVTAANDTTLVFSLETSCPNFPELTAGARFMPCNESFFTSTGGRYGLSPSYLITNGPFTFPGSYSWVDGKSIGLSFSQSYKGENAVLPTSLTFIMGENQEIAAAPVDALSKGNADILKINQEDVAAAQAAGCQIYSFKNEVTGLLFNTDDSNMSNAKLRELFVKTVDRENLLSILPDSSSVTAANDIVPQGLTFGGSDYRTIAESNLYIRQDDTILETKEKIIDSLDGNVIPSVTIICRDDSLSTSIANSVISSWNSKIGTYFNILPLTDAEYNTRIANRDYQIALYTIESSGDTAYSMLNAFESTASPQLLNSSAYDTLLHAGDNSIQSFTGLEKFINNQYIFYPVAQHETYYAVNQKIKGLIVGIGRVDFKRATK